MIAEQEIQQFSEMGAVTIDTPLTQQQLSAASAVFDRLLPFSEPEAGEEPRYRVSTTCTFYGPELLDIIQHPFFEEVAKRVLRADEISFFQTAIVTTYPVTKYSLQLLPTRGCPVHPLESRRYSEAHGLHLFCLDR